MAGAVGLTYFCCCIASVVAVVVVVVREVLDIQVVS